MDTQPGQMGSSQNDNLGQAAPQTAGSTPPAEIEQPEQAPATPTGSVGQSAPTETAAQLPVLQPPAPETNPGGGLYAPDQGQGDSWWQSEDAGMAGAAQPLPEDVSWTASEFVEHPKGAGWYGLLGLASIVLVGINYYLTKDVVSSCIIILAAITFGVYAGHKPSVQQYRLDAQGLHIGEKLYDFRIFKAFSVVEEGAVVSVVFVPLRRLVPPLTVYVASDMEEKVLDYVSAFLPFEQNNPDIVDGFIRRIRF